MDKIAPLHTVRISSKQFYREPWVTNGIETSAQKNLKLYKNTLMSHSTPEDVEKYKSHRNLLNRVRRHAKHSYYIGKCHEYKNNTHNFGK